MSTQVSFKPSFSCLVTKKKNAYIWKETVAAGNATDELEEWAEDVIRIEGWARIIGGYDSLERVAQLKDGTWFPYIRSD